MLASFHQKGMYWKTMKKIILALFFSSQHKHKPEPAHCWEFRQWKGSSDVWGRGTYTRQTEPSSQSISPGETADRLGSRWVGKFWLSFSFWSTGFKLKIKRVSSTWNWVSWDGEIKVWWTFAYQIIHDLVCVANINSFLFTELLVNIVAR